MILFAARRRQGGAGGGAINSVELKLVGKRGGSHDGDDDVTGAVTAAVFCFFFLEAKLNFCAALRERGREQREEGDGEKQSDSRTIIRKLHFENVKTNSEYFQ